MKRRTVILLLLLTLSLASLSGISTASASNDYQSSTYLRIITDDTPLYSDSLGTKLLYYLPYTYYVRVISLGDTLSRVECAGENSPAIDGYVPTNMLYEDNLPVASPYPNVKLRTAYQTVLYADVGRSKPLQYVFAERELNFYGKVDGEITMYYVGYGDRLGYVVEGDIYPFELTFHPNELTFLPSDEPEVEADEETSTEGDYTSLRIIIFVCLGAAGLIALLLVLKKKPQTQTAVSYYDENDYE